MQSPQSCADAADAEQALRMGMESPEWYDSSAVAPEKDTSSCAFYAVRFAALQETERPPRRIQYCRRRASRAIVMLCRVV